MTDNPFADAFPLVVSRRIYDLAVAGGVDPRSLDPIDPPPQAGPARTTRTVTRRVTLGSPAESRPHPTEHPR
jgi:hypothetical protein